MGLFCTYSFHGNSMSNLLSLCGLIDAKIRASDKDLLVLSYTIKDAKPELTNSRVCQKKFKMLLIRKAKDNVIL